MAIPDSLALLERDLREIFGARLQSLVAYGVGATKQTHADDHAQRSGHNAERSLTNTLAIAETLTAEDLRACAGRVKKWDAAGLATPLLLAAHEFERSLDAFPLEFGAIVADHVVVSGKNPFEGLRVDAADVRRACELQARSHLLHLREGYLETRENADALAVLIVQSAAPFAALLASIARLQGAATRDAAASGRHVERLLDVPGGVVSDVVTLAGVTEISAAEATRIFPAYLDAVEKLVKYVDGWSDGSR
jgi:hypothetical protein